MAMTNTILTQIHLTSAGLIHIALPIYIMKKKRCESSLIIINDTCMTTSRKSNVVSHVSETPL